MEDDVRDDLLNLAEWRKLAFLTQEELGSRLGISGGQVSRIESGKRDYDGRYLFKLKRIINERLRERWEEAGPDRGPLVQVNHIGELLQREPKPEWLYKQASALLIAYAEHQRLAPTGK